MKQIESLLCSWYNISMNTNQTIVYRQYIHMYNIENINFMLYQF